MSEVKAGDVAWFRGRLVEWEDGSRRASQVLSDTAIPDSPSLPAVARWLAETPDVVGVVRAGKAAIHRQVRRDQRDGFDMDAKRGQHIVDVLEALVAALATDAADGGAR